MATTQPIRNKQDLQIFTAYYQSVKPNPRNQALIILGLYTALRIGDILELRWGDIYDFDRESFRPHICVQEKKTGKQSIIAQNVHIRKALAEYMRTREVSPGDYIFTKNTDHHIPICRSQAFRIIKKAAKAIGQEHVSCHSLRKTFGYHAWKQGTPPALLMDIYNHSSYQITKKYLGIAQDERDMVYLSIEI
ncbi:MAG: tyrosine-type recombinase/integrase [Roseburia sp.]